MTDRLRQAPTEIPEEVFRQNPDSIRVTGSRRYSGIFAFSRGPMIGLAILALGIAPIVVVWLVATSKYKSVFPLIVAVCFMAVGLATLFRSIWVAAYILAIGLPVAVTVHTALSGVQQGAVIVFVTVPALFLGLFFVGFIHAVVTLFSSRK